MCFITGFILGNQNLCFCQDWERPPWARLDGSLCFDFQANELGPLVFLRLQSHHTFVSVLVYRNGARFNAVEVARLRSSILQSHITLAIDECLIGGCAACYVLVQAS
jgi:hypothetical protein